MTKIDQFESVFKASAKERYSFTPIEIGRVLVVTDLDEYEARLFRDEIGTLVAGVETLTAASWSETTGQAARSLQDLLDTVEKQRPDLVCSYRNLYSGAWRYPYCLGEHLEVLTQLTSTPVLLMPRPARSSESQEPRYRGTSSVMAITDHLTGDHRLVDWAAHFTQPGGALFLTHVEDSAIYQRYHDVISKIPSIDTEPAALEIRQQLLKEPHDYVASCKSVLERARSEIEVNELVRMGHHLTEYKALIEEHALDLLVMNTKDDKQQAMHGLAYPLAVELRDVPLLML